MTNPRIYSLLFSDIYPLYLQKIERKNRSKAELDQVLVWLTGYSQADIESLKRQPKSLKDFFDQAPAINPNAIKITGVICGYRVENITDQLTKQIRWMDKLVDELAKGKALNKILRS